MPEDFHKYPSLNLPAAQLRIELRDGHPVVYDPLRHQWVALTPEEHVRQHFTSWLTGELGYPASRTANEVSLRLNRTSRRADTVVYDNYGRPLMIVEYKRPSVEITRRVFDQILRYNIVLRARYLVVTNGMRHYCCEIIDPDTGAHRFLPEIPRFA